MFNNFRQNDLFTVCQSSLIPEDSCDAQLLSVNHEIYQSLNVTQRKILRGFSSIFQKLLVKCSMKVYFLNCSLVE